MGNGFQYSTLSLIQLLAGLIALGTGILVWRRRNAFPEARLLAFSLWSAFLWCAMEGTELCLTSLDSKTLMSQLGYLGFFTPFWIWLFAYDYSTNGRRPPRALTYGLAGFIFLSFLVALTNSQHHLLWEDIRLYDSNGLTNALYMRGPWFWAIVLVAYGLMVSATAMLFAHALNSNRTVRLQNWITVIAMLIPWLISAFYILRIPVLGEVDSTPVGFVASGILFSWNTLRVGLFKVVPFSGQTILERMPDPVFVLDNQERVSVLNPAAAARFSIAAESYGGRPVDEVVGGANPIMREALGRARTQEIVLFSERGVWWEILSSSLSDSNERPLGRLHVLRDTTAMHRALLLAAQNEQLAQKANEAKSMFIAQVSHDLRTPMHAILGSLELLQDAKDGVSQSSQLGTAREAAEALLTLTNDLLDLSRIEAGKVELRPRAFMLDEVLDSVSDMLGVIASKKSLELRHVIDSGLGRGMRGDPDRLRQILVNIVGNALKFTSKGGVQVRAAADTERPGMLRLTVQDTGPGISEDVMPTLFNAFERGDSRIAARHEGTGLGLAISKRLAEAMGGGITVSSILGEGSTFEIRLPLRDETAEAELRIARAAEIRQSEACMGERRRRLKVLLADDDPLSRRVSAAMLRNSNCDVSLADDGLAALDHLKAESFDAVILDGIMPVMDGWETSRRITSASGEVRPPPVIAISADLTPEAQARWRSCGASVVLPKPLSQRDLRVGLESLFPSQ